MTALRPARGERCVYVSRVDYAAIEDARFVARFFLDHCGRSCAGCGSGPSVRTLAKIAAVDPSHAEHLMKCSASSFGWAPTRLPIYFPARDIGHSEAVSERATRRPASSRSRVYEMDPGTSRASYGNVGLAIAGLVKLNLYLQRFRGTSIDCAPLRQL